MNRSKPVKLRKTHKTEETGCMNWSITKQMATSDFETNDILEENQYGRVFPFSFAQFLLDDRPRRCGRPKKKKQKTAMTIISN